MSTLLVDRMVVRLGDFVVGPVNLSLGPGVHHLRGPNGAGKTTLLRALCGDLRPTEGMVRIDGFDPWTQTEARARVAYVPATPGLPSFLTVDEAWQTMAALRGAPDWDGSERRDALQLPGGLMLSHASVGQRHRAELLAGLAAEPAVLLLDEPFAGLDGRGQQLLSWWMMDWRSHRVVLMTGHEPLGFEVDSEFELLPGRPLMHSGW